MCNGYINEEVLNNIVYVNLQNNETLDMTKVIDLKDNAMLKIKPELWVEWDFKKNDGFDIWKMTKGKNDKVWWICEKCESGYDSAIANRIKNKGCPYCSGRKVTHTNSLASLNPEIASQWHPTLNGELTPHDVTCGSGHKVWWLGTCGHEWKAVINKRTFGQSCPYCSSAPTVLKGFNDIWATNPDLAKLLANSEDGYKYTQGSKTKVDWKCPSCRQIIRNKAIYFINDRGLSCPNCSDGISYPEKLMNNLLKLINISYVNSYADKWTNGKIYDFYIPSLNMIIETHGMQHYEGGFHRLGGRCLQEEQENDNYKKQLAVENGIEKYIIIDSRYSDLEFIKNSISNSELAELFNLSKVDWIELSLNASKSTHIQILELWNKGINRVDISKSLNISVDTIKNVIKKFESIGLCESRVVRRKSTISSKVYQFNIKGELIRVWNSTREVSNELDLNINLVANACNGNKRTYKNNVWKYEHDALSYIMMKLGM